MTHTNVAAAEWRAHWTVVLAAMVGLSFSSLAPASLGLFIEPLTEEFGWTRAQISLGITMYALFAVPFSPLLGALIDRHGSRRIGIPGLVLTSCAFAAFSLANGSVAQWLVLWLIYSTIALTIKSTVWTAAVSNLFSASRGLALAVVFCGTAISQTASPLLARWLIDEQGWREAYLWLGLGWGGAALLLAVLFLIDPHHGKGKNAQQVSGPLPRLSGLSFAEALRSEPLRKIAAATLLSSVLIGALIVHQVPILTGRGVLREHAALLAALTGFASLFGKLCTGYLFDRSQSGWIGFGSLSLPAIGCTLLLLPSPSLWVLACAMVILGYTAGAYLQLCTYLTTRYGGMLNFGKIFGVMASLLALGTGVGPVIGGLVFDFSGSYVPLLAGGILAGILSGILVARLGPYPEFETQPSSPAPAYSGAGQPIQSRSP